MRKLILLLFTTLSLSYFSQKNQVAFSGELLYNIEKLSPADSLPAKMLLYAKDSLLKVINFSSTIGKQEMIKHLRLNRSYVLVSTTKGDFAIKTDHNAKIDSLQEYTFKKKIGRKRIAGMKAKRALVKINGIDEKFNFYYTPKINARLQVRKSVDSTHRYPRPGHRIISASAHTNQPHTRPTSWQQPARQQAKQAKH